MKRIVRFFGLPFVTLLGSFWLIYDHWIAPDPMWRFPKAEAAGPILFVIAIAALVYELLAFLRTSKPITPGMNVMFDDANGQPIVGRVVAVETGGLVVHTPAGQLLVARDAISDIV